MSYQINKSWTTLPNRFCKEYRRGVDEFVTLARDFVNSEGKVKCPCRKCLNRFRQTLERLENHLYINGFQQTYIVWIYHGEDYPPLGPSVNEPEFDEVDNNVDIAKIASAYSDIEGARLLDGLHRCNDDDPEDEASVQRPIIKKAKRGPSRGTNVDKHIQKYGKITLQFDAETGQPYGKWASGFNNAISQIVRSEVSPRTAKWSTVDPRVKTQVVVGLLEKFIFNRNEVTILEHIEMQCMNSLRDWRCRLRGHFYAVRGDVDVEEAKKHVSKECDEDDWKWLCDYFSTPEQLAISARNKANRSKKLYPSKQGSKSNVAHRYEMANKQTKELPDMITMFRKMHWSEKTGWSSDLARVHFEEMLEQVAQGKDTTGGSSREALLASSAADQIYHDVVGKRSRYKKGIGALPRLKALDGQTRVAPGTYRAISSSCQDHAAEVQRLNQRLDQQNTVISSLYDIISRMAPIVGVSVPPMPSFVGPTSDTEGTSGAGEGGPPSSQGPAQKRQRTSLGSSQPKHHDSATSFDPYLS